MVMVAGQCERIEYHSLHLKRVKMVNVMCILLQLQKKRGGDLVKANAIAATKEIEN